jgi:Spy/CpxP family protein refolding chaperone
MATGRAKALIALGFAAALLGGASAGLLLDRYVRPPGPAVVAGDVPLSTELQLTADQRTQIRQIWEQVRTLNQGSFDDGQALEHWRDDQILKILSGAQVKDFEKINNEYQERYTAMTAKRGLAFKEAVARTKQLLTEEQRRRYEQILARRGVQEDDGVQPGSTRPASTVSSAD